MLRGRELAEQLVGDRRESVRQVAVDLIIAIGHINGLDLAIRLREAARSDSVAAGRR
jgi:hypothetical protein